MGAGETWTMAAAVESPWQVFVAFGTMRRWLETARNRQRSRGQMCGPSRLVSSGRAEGVGAAKQAGSAQDHRDGRAEEQITIVSYAFLSLWFHCWKWQRKLYDHDQYMCNHFSDRLDNC